MVFMKHHVVTSALKCDILKCGWQWGLLPWRLMGSMQSGVVYIKGEQEGLQAGHEGSMVKWKFHLEQENRLYPGKETKFCITGSFLQLHSNRWLHNENVLSVLMASRKIFCMQYFMDWHETVLRTANIFPELEPRPENKACPNHSRAAAGGGPNPAPCCSPLGWIVPGSSPRWKSLRSLSGCSY